MASLPFRHASRSAVPPPNGVRLAAAEASRGGSILPTEEPAGAVRGTALIAVLLATKNVETKGT